MLKIIDYLHKNLLKTLYSEICFGCKNVLLYEEKYLCIKCLHDLPLTEKNENNLPEISQKLYGILPVEKSSSLVFYYKKSPVQQLIHALKFKNNEKIGEWLAFLTIEQLKNTTFFDDIEVLIPVPIHKKRNYERGYNQVHLYSSVLANYFNKKYEENVLLRTKYEKSQITRTKEERLNKIKNSFIIQNYDNLEGKHLLLIDDVFTTGATIESCGKELLKIPNIKLSVLTIAFAKN